MKELESFAEPGESNGFPFELLVSSCGHFLYLWRASQE